MGEDRDFGTGWSERRDRGRYSDERGGYGRRSAGGSGYDSYGSGRGDFDQRRGGGYGRGDFSEAVRAGMTGRGMDMAAPSSGAGGGYGERDYGRRDHGGSGHGQGGYRSGSEGRGFFGRAGDEVASWFGDDDTHRGRGPRNYSRSDERIREDVSDRLSHDRHLDASDIEVTVSGGEVTLDGTVDSRAAKRHAEDLAEDCSGVKHVQNNLRVRDRQASGGTSGGTTNSGTGASSNGQAGMRQG